MNYFLNIHIDTQCITIIATLTFSFQIPEFLSQIFCLFFSISFYWEFWKFSFFKTHRNLTRMCFQLMPGVGLHQISHSNRTSFPLSSSIVMILPVLWHLEFRDLLRGWINARFLRGSIWWWSSLMVLVWSFICIGCALLIILLKYETRKNKLDIR